MNTKVKVGIAALIVSALIALIVLDQKTAPREEPAAPAEPGALRARDADEFIFQRAEEQFRLPGGRTPADAGPIKLDQPPSIRQIAPQRPAQPEEYVIREGDRLSDIAQRHYGSAQEWTRIARANPGLNPNALRPGRKIVLPPRGELPAEPPAPERAAFEEPLAPAPAPLLSGLPPAAEPLPTSYVVQPGDTLSGISKKLYNTARYSDRIFQANRDRLQNPNDIRVGMNLNLPEGLARDPGAVPAVAAPGHAGAAVAVSADAPAAGRIVHQVRPNDSLWKIAERYCGDRGIEEMIHAIVRANPDKLRDARALLRVGWQLVIPD